VTQPGFCDGGARDDAGVVTATSVTRFPFSFSILLQFLIRFCSIFPLFYFSVRVLV